MRKLMTLAVTGLVMVTSVGCVESNGYPTTYYGGYPSYGYTQPSYGYGYGYRQPTYYQPAPVVTQTRYVPVPVPRPSYWSGRRDSDRDGIPNRYDRDRNGDGVPDRWQR